MSTKTNRITTAALILAVAATLMSGVALVTSTRQDTIFPVPPPAGGTSHFTNLEASGTITYSSDDLTPLGFDGATEYEIYFGTTATITGSTTITAATHGLDTAVDVAYCWPTTPDDDAGDPYLCDPSWSTTVLTLSILQDDATAATTGDTVSYIAIGR
jgi:hypothetical protein